MRSETLRTPKRYSLHLYLGPTIPLGRLWPSDDDADDDDADADADADDDDDSLFMKRYCLVLSLMHTGCILLKGQLSHSLEIKKKYYKKCFYVNSVSLSLGMMDGYQSV